MEQTPDGGPSVTAPILLYHHVSDEAESNRYYVNPFKFEQQMSLLHSLGYTSIPISQLVDALLKDAELPERPLVISFDDGVLDIYQTAFPIMQKYGFTGTMYLVGKYLGASGYISAAQMGEMVNAGWEVGSHGMSHARLFEAVSLTEEILESRAFLSEKVSAQVNTFAYPFGSYDEMLAGKVKSYGYLAAVGLGTSSVHNLDSLFYLSRIEVKQDMDFYEFNSKLPWKSSDLLFFRMSD